MMGYDGPFSVAGSMVFYFFVFPLLLLCVAAVPWLLRWQ